MALPIAFRRSMNCIFFILFISSRKRVFLIKWKTGYHPEYKGVQYYKKHGKTEPCKKLKIVFGNKMPQVYKGFPIYVPDK